MALLDIVDNADLTRLQRFVQATTLLPGEDAAISSRDLNNLAKAAKAFAEASSREHAITSMEKLVAAYEGTRFHGDVERRVDTVVKRWKFQARKTVQS
jgi:hypothetical protein